jgi:simple sugar transport system permease protein
MSSPAPPSPSPGQPAGTGALAAPGGPADPSDRASGVRAAFTSGSALSSLVSSAGAVAIALLLGAVVIALSGDDPIEAYRALVRGALGDLSGISETLVAATPLILAGLGFMVAFRAGLFNIGLEGQLVLGGLAAGLVATYSLGPGIVALPLVLLVAVVVGGSWGALAGILKARTGASEVITTIMLNYLAFRIGTWAVSAEDLLPVDPGLVATESALDEATLPTLPETVGWLDDRVWLPGWIAGVADDRHRVHFGIVVGVLAAAILWYLLFKTTFGYRIRTVGLSRGAAAYAGISWGQTIVLAMFLSGALAGLAGAGEALGLNGRYYNSSAGLGFTAIAVGLVGRNHPAGVVLAGLLFGMLKSGATEMQNTAGTSKELVQILQALVILAIAAFASANRLRVGRRVTERFGRSPTAGPAAPSRRDDRASAIDMEPEIEPRPGPEAI